MSSSSSSSSSIAASRVSQIVSHLTAAPAAAAAGPVVSIVSRANGVAVILINNPPVNSLSPAVQSGIGAAYEDACADASIKAVVLTGANGAFMAGADLENVVAMQHRADITPAAVRAFVAGGNVIFNRLESGPKPVVAAIDGVALGGGCELAMVCASRLATARSVFGQPELTLGIIPGLGGTQRFPRLIGLQTAVTATLSGKNIPAKAALKLGLIDAIVPPAQLLAQASALALDIASGKVPRGNASKKQDKIGSYELGGKAIIETARAAALRKNPLVPHPRAYLEAVEEGLKNGFDSGLQREIDLMAGLVLHPVAKSLMHFFFATRATTKGLAAKPSGKPLQTVAVLGGGTMGAGICIVYLLKGYNVILKELNDALVLAGVERIVNDLQRIAKARKMPVYMVEGLMRNFSAQTSYAGFDKVDLVVEAVIENLKLKQQIFAELEKHCPAHAILSTNTSTIDILEIGALTRCEDRIVGLHFFSPAHVMPLLEIIRTTKTSANTIAATLAMSKRIGKTPVVVGNCVGFTANRAFFPYGQAAGMLVDAGADPYVIDRALEMKVGMPMGVFRMADLSGIDVFKHVSGTINAAYGSRCYNSSLGESLFQAKRLGQKSGVGYYKYVKGKPVPDASLKQFLDLSRSASASSKPSVDASKLNPDELVEVVLFPVVNEALRILEEGFARTAADVDVITVMGYGFPAWQGGVLHWAESHPKGGFKYVRDRLATLSSKWGGAANPTVAAFFKPCALLEKKAEGKK